MDAEALAEKLVALINEKPQSPRKDEIMSVLLSAAQLGVSSSNPPDIVIVGSRAGATITITPDSKLAFDGFQVALRQGVQPSPEDVALAILDFMRAALVEMRAGKPTIN